MKAGQSISALCIALCCMVCSGFPIIRPLPVSAAAIEIKLAHVDPPDTRKSVGANLFKQILETETRGAIEVRVFPAGQLGGEREQIEGIKFGTIQMTMVSGAIASFYKEAQVLDIPYLFSSAPVAWKVLDGPFGKEMAEDCLQKTGMRVLGYGEAGFRNFTNSIKTIRTPADLKGMKIRVQESPVYMNLIKSLGGAPTPIPTPEMYTALQQKVVDGQENPVSVIRSFKLYEVQKFLTLDGHTYGVDFILINNTFYQSLPKALQNAVRTAAATTVTIMRGYQTTDATQGIQQLKDKGMEIYSPSDSEKEMFRAATQKPGIELLERQIGRVWIDKLLKAIKEAEAELLM